MSVENAIKPIGNITSAEIGVFLVAAIVPPLSGDQLMPLTETMNKLGQLTLVSSDQHDQTGISRVLFRDKALQRTSEDQQEAFHNALVQVVIDQYSYAYSYQTQDETNKDTLDRSKLTTSSRPAKKGWTNGAAMPLRLTPQDEETRSVASQEDDLFYAPEDELPLFVPTKVDKQPFRTIDS